MKIGIKSGGTGYQIEFTIGPGRGDTHLTAMAKTSAELDKLKTAVINREHGEEAIGVIIAKVLEKKLKLPVEVDYGYRGAGFGFKFDLYSIAKKLK